MAKITVSASHVAEYPSLKDKLGKTVDASVIQQAKSDKKVVVREEKKAEAQVASALKPKAPAKKKVVRKVVAKTVKAK